jgi:hypothetical protein
MTHAEQRLEHEITVWANLQHNHILPFYGIVTDQGQHILMVGIGTICFCFDFLNYSTRSLRGKIMEIFLSEFFIASHLFESSHHILGSVMSEQHLMWTGSIW